ncbi:MAG: radical SAM protein [Bacteroidaceae bacterium]|nr:radical SAM protein [Bacteroidaceae bacterium]
MLERKEITALWETGERAFRQVAASELLASFPDKADLLLSMVSEGAPELLEMVRERFPFLRRGFANPEPDTAARRYTYFDELARQEEAFLKALATDTATRTPTAISSLTDLPSVSAAGLASVSKKEAPHQLMVFVTGHCNLHCPYCFSADAPRKEIGADDLRRVFRWAAGQGCGQVTPCGGEPLLYRHIALFLRLVREHGMTTYLATNFTRDIANLDGFDSTLVRQVYIHLTAETLADARLADIVSRNIATGKARRIEMTGRLNLTGANTDDVLRLTRFFADAGLKRVHFALTIPSERVSNNYTDPAAFARFVPEVERAMDFAEACGLTVGIAKPMPPCLFPKHRQAKLLSQTCAATMCNIHEDGGMKNVCLSPDLLFSPCLGVSHPSVAFRDDLTWNELSAVFAPRVQRLLGAPPMARCAQCYLWARRLCQGYCLSYKDRL